jgi:hypothetical protein
MATAGPRIPPIDQTVGINPDVISDAIHMDENLSVFFGLLKGETNLPAGAVLFDTASNSMKVTAAPVGAPPTDPDLRLDVEGTGEMTFFTSATQQAVITNAGLVGINQTIPGSTLTVEGSQAVSVTNVTAGTTTLNDTHYAIFADCTAGTCVVRLPTTATPANRDRVYVIKKTDSSANPVNIQTPIGIAIDGVVGITPLVVQYQSITVCAGTNSDYFII